jgi:serine protease Do
VRTVRAAAALAVAFATGAVVALGASSVHDYLAQGGPALAASPIGVRYVNQSPPNEVMTTNLIADVAAKAEPAVVTVTAHIPGSTQSDGFFPFAVPPQTSNGSGFIISSDGYIVTNDHVIEGASSIQVSVNGYPHPFAARLVGASFALDLAVLKIQAPRPLPTLPLGNSDATRVGQWDIAIGNPYGLSNTLTVGVISAEGRPLTIGNRNYQDLLQTDAPINPGNSGGPLLNLAGQVIGINTAVQANGQGLGFAIPINTARKVLGDLLTKGYVPHPWLGVGVVSDNPANAAQYGLSVDQGAIVAQVMSGSPAARAGLQVGDVITAVNGRAVASAQALVDAISSRQVGETVTLTLARGSQTLTVRVRLAQEPNNLPSGTTG